jgi:hypothetical protein
LNSPSLELNEKTLFSFIKNDSPNQHGIPCFLYNSLDSGMDSQPFIKELFANNALLPESMKIELL